VVVITRATSPAGGPPLTYDRRKPDSHGAGVRKKASQSTVLGMVVPPNYGGAYGATSGLFGKARSLKK
jgi:hypothetical protein